MVIHKHRPKMNPYFTLQSALKHLCKNTVIIAQDNTANGQKVFFCEQIRTLIRKYATLEKKHWYECLVEHRPSRIFLDVESTSSVNVNAIVTFVQLSVRQMFGVDALVEVLDSSSVKKFSWHIIVMNGALRNVYHVGAFVRRMVLAMMHVMETNRASFGSGEVSAIDTAVYTKNRMFRVAGSSKYGSERILKNPKTWDTLLVQSGQFHNVYECKEIDGSEPMSTSLSPEKLFVLVGPQEWSRISMAKRTSQARTTCTLVSPVLDWLDRHLDAQCQRQSMTCSENGAFRVSTRSKKCCIAKRTHRGNNIWFELHLNSMQVFQRCYDEDCRRQSVKVDVPHAQWSRWQNAWSQVIHAPMNENTLFNISY